MTHSDSNLRISACEYDAPTTRFGSRAGFFPAILVSLWAALKKGGVELNNTVSRKPNQPRSRCYA